MASDFCNRPELDPLVLIREPPAYSECPDETHPPKMAFADSAGVNSLQGLLPNDDLPSIGLAENDTNSWLLSLRPEVMGQVNGDRQDLAVR